MIYSAASKSNILHPRRQFRRGAAAVEFALTAPILFTLVMGAIQLSRANMLVHTASIAATEAARRSIVPGATASEVEAAAARELAIVGIAEADVFLDPPVITDDTDQVTVDLTIPLGGRNGYSLARIFLGKNLAKTVTLQREGKTSSVSAEVPKQDGVFDEPSSGSSNSGSGNSGSGSSNSGSSNSGSGSSSSGRSSSSSSALQNLINAIRALLGI